MFSKASRKNTLVIIFLTFASLLGFPIIAPALPSVRDAFNISTSDIGLVMAAYSAPGIIFIPVMGILADRYGKKKVLLPSMLLFAVGGTACAVANNTETLLLFRFLQGIGACALATINVSWAADLFEDDERIKIMGYIGATQNIGSGILPIIGGVLASIAWFYPFLISLMVLPLGMYLLIFMEKESQEKIAKSANTKNFITYAWQHLNDKIVIEIVFMTGAFIFIGFGALITYLPIFLKDTFNTPETIIGIIVGSRAVMGVITATRLSIITKYFSYRIIIFVSFLTLAVGMLIIPYSNNQWVIILTTMCYGGAFGLLRPSLQYLLLEHAPTNLRSTFASASNFGLRLSQTLSPIFAGLYLTFGSFEGLYISAAILAIFMAIFSLTATSLKAKR
ncbi:MAG: MFS transporter [Rhodospirillaceae bacterium]|nr:MFS transporter [Rhodospirillaceae bacterium]